MSAILVDTNVLVCAHDRGEFAKQEWAIEVLRQLHLTDSGVLSTQCLGEFFRAVTRGPRPKLTVDEAASQVDRLARAWRVLNVTPQVVLEAVRGVQQHQLAYWDAQIWAAARLNQIPVVFSEDFSTGSVLEGVQFVNPLVAGFRLERWVE
jgi:predicted nucleic acid-binding protein